MDYRLTSYVFSNTLLCLFADKAFGEIGVLVVFAAHLVLFFRKD